jgi:hypothetical protein
MPTQTRSSTQRHDMRQLRPRSEAEVFGIPGSDRVAPEWRNVDA